MAMLGLVVLYAILNFQRYQVYRMLPQSFVPLSVLILAGARLRSCSACATPMEAAGDRRRSAASLLAALYRQLTVGGC